MSVAFNYSTSVTIHTCGECGAPVALANEESLRRSKATFYCPNGHGRAFTGMTDAERLEGELAREKQRREMAEREVTQERKRAQKAERKTKRIAKGVCSCCNRSFTNLRRHMETQHPEEAK